MLPQRTHQRVSSRTTSRPTRLTHVHAGRRTLPRGWRAPPGHAAAAPAPSGCCRTPPGGALRQPRTTVIPSSSSSSSSSSSPGADAPAAPQQQLYAGKRAVVIGAGPAGSMAAIYLARAGFAVDVFEGRPEPNDDEVDRGRAYIIILIPRGQAALKQLGVPLPTQQEFITKGTVRHPKQGPLRITREEGNVTFSRSGLAQYLIDQARRLYPQHIRYHFNTQCTGVDVAGHSVSFRDPGGSSTRASYDLLVGADGTRSAVRAALQAAYPDMSVSIEDSGREYKTYRNLAGDIEPDEFKAPGATLHLWTTDASDPLTTVTAHRNPDGNYSGTFSLATGAWSKLTSPQQVEELLRTKFSGVPEAWIPEIAEQVFKEPASPAGKRIKCSRLDGPGIVLLGDAAHAVTPVFGQGANSALESAKVLGEALQQAGGDVDAVPSLFNAARLDDMHALNELDRKAYSFFRRKGLFDKDFMQLLSHVVLGTVLSKVLPFLFDKPALLQLGSTVRYSTITAAVRRDSLLAAAGFAALGLWLSFKLAAKVLAGAA